MYSTPLQDNVGNTYVFLGCATHFSSTGQIAFRCLSLPVWDWLPPTGARCQPCSAGIQQLSAGAVECDACPSGTFKAAQSVDECAPCALAEGKVVDYG